ncbi:MAG: hypothetical protein ABH986_04185, partial [archaeon]
MKKENKILLLLALFCLLVVLFIELTSPVVLYRDPYMYRHLNAAEFVLEKQKADIFGENLEKDKFFAKDFLNGKLKLFFFVIPILSAVTLNFFSGLGINFLFNHFWFLLFIAALSFFILFREIFRQDFLALGLALIVVLFPFEPLYYKITIHGWFFVRIFAAVSLYFLVKFLKEQKKKYLFFVVFFSFLSVYSDKSAFAIVLIPLILFFVVYFFFDRKNSSAKKNFLSLFFLFFSVLIVFSVFNIFSQMASNLNAILYNLKELNFIPSFLSKGLPYSGYYLEKDFWYLLLRYVIPSLTVFFLIAFNFQKIKSFFSKDLIMKSFIFSQIVFCFLIAFGMLYSFSFISNRGASMIFLFFSFVCFIGLHQMKKSFLKYSLVFLFFFLVLVLPFVFFTQAPQYKYEQFNEKHLASIEWVQENLEKNSFIYSDVKMAKAVSLETDVVAVNPRKEFGVLMENYIIPVYFDSNVEKVLQAFREQNINYLLLTKEMSSVAVQPANELLMPATELK